MRHHLTSENGYDCCLICGGQWPISEDDSTEPDIDCLGLAPDGTSWYHGQGELGCPGCGVDIGGDHDESCRAVPVQPGACDCALCDPSGHVESMASAQVKAAHLLTQINAYVMAGAELSVAGAIVVTSATDSIYNDSVTDGLTQDLSTLHWQVREDYATL